jgi:Ca2+-binding EF-hand superfamily protein
MLRQHLITFALLATMGCQSENEQSNLNQAPAEDRDVKSKSTDAKLSDTDKHVYAFLYAQQALQSSADYLLPSEFDSVAYVNALLEVRNGIISDSPIEDVYDLLKVAASEEVQRSVAALVMENADKNNDKKIDYNEFLAFRIGKWEPTPELDENINVWREAAFPIIAGSDMKINNEELLALIVMQRKHVQSTRPDLNDFRKLFHVTRDQFINNFDSDGDGRLDRDELRDIKAAVLEERDRYMEKVKSICVDPERKEDPICRADKALSEVCADVKEGSLMERFCKALSRKE